MHTSNGCGPRNPASEKLSDFGKTLPSEKTGAPITISVRRGVTFQENQKHKATCFGRTRVRRLNSLTVSCQHETLGAWYNA